MQKTFHEWDLTRCFNVNGNTIFLIEAAFDMRNINVVQMIYTRPNNFCLASEQLSDLCC